MNMSNKLLELNTETIKDILHPFVDLDIALTKDEKHQLITQELHAMYKDKNMKYGDAFGETIRKYGKIAGLTRLHDKFSRIEAFILNGYEDSEESLIDSLNDIANYAIMLRMEVEEY